MGREKKRGTSGNAKAFITRAKALKKLQLTIPEFRRLCILKGVYPRNPRKKLEGSDKTYYLRKDIDFLAHERLIVTLRHQNAHQKKVVKARAKRRLDILKRLALNTPRARLDHLIVERYPRFDDALRDLDDPLCIIALFAHLPVDHALGIAPERIANCQRLLREFCHFIADTRALTRVFASIKGYYFQARVRNVNVTWVTPHRFSQVLPTDVDFSVMLTFLELYECILSFVNFRLYTESNLAYPPKVNLKADANALQLDSLLVESTEQSKSNDAVGIILEGDTPSAAATPLPKDVVEAAQKIALNATAEDEEDDEDDVLDDDEEGPSTDGVEDDGVGDDEQSGDQSDDDESLNDDDGENKEEVASDKPEGVSGATDANAEDDEDDVNDDKPIVPEGVFCGKNVVLGREVPFIELEFTLRAAGASRVTREDDLLSGKDNLDGYTHWIIDRPKLAGERNMALEYVQPQYVFDSVNAGMLLPTSLYAMGAPLPPHLSPFLTKAHDGGYRPWFQDVLEKIKSGDASVVGEAAAVVYAEGEARAKRGPVGSSSDDVGKVKDDETVVAEEVPEEDSDGEHEETDDRAKAIDRSKHDEDEESSDEEAEVEEKDSEGEEERAVTEKRAKTEAENKEMATLMMSRKKLRTYKKIKGQELHQESKKRKLTAKRDKLEEERAELVNTKAKKRRKRDVKVTSE